MIEYESHRSDVSDYLYHQTDKNLNFGTHLHRSFEFFYLQSGELTLTVEDKSFDMQAGQCALILPLLPHSYRTARASESYLCVFSVTYLYDLYESTRGLTAHSPVFRLPEADRLADELRAPDIGPYLVKACLYRAADGFARSARLRPRGGHPQLAERVLRYLEEHFSEDLSLKALAAELGYDYHYLSSLLSGTLHADFSHLVNACRIQHAQALLKSTSLPVTEIALRCGYGSLRTFNRNFRRFTGSTPCGYRTASL